jgi:hypothetical protein
MAAELGEHRKDVELQGVYAKSLQHNEYSEVTGKAEYSFLSYSVLFGAAAVGV